MLTVTLPRLGGTRQVADQVIDAQAADVPDGDTVVLLGRDLVSSSASFADQFVKRLLQEGPASTIAVVSPPQRFREHILRSADERGLSGRVVLETGAALGV